MFGVDFLSILVAGAASVAIAFVWYHPKIFGGAWLRLVALSPEAAEKGKRRMPLSAFFALLSGMLVAYVMSYFGLAWGVYDWVGAIELGFWCWVGFTAPTMLGRVLWEQKPLRLFFIDALFWLVAFVAIALVLVF